ncbi:hypothetical protein Y032_0384g389 [Ancylostoma ceylanicum]|uniref:Serine-threonine/tyrosine-protein kinase catalytic domain-containing protein n=1 Tax=Ancylostoma ceylanicum TaxID=53326 RepID=A0A016RSV0_9BILA|nr:hypothetical protein Y032_0384g389 [Ancylostoma ceylanicum]
MLNLITKIINENLTKKVAFKLIASRLQLRKLDHDNVNKFLGISFDGMDYMVVWKMCSRGSLLVQCLEILHT